MLHAVMDPERVYSYPIWAVSLSMAAAAAIASVLLEIVVQRFVSTAVRRRHNVLTAAIFSIVGVTYAVLLAFVAMLAWEQFNNAKAASGHEAAVLLDVDRIASGLGEPARTAVHGGVVGYAQAVIGTEWPAQAEGRSVRAGELFLDRIDRAVLDLRPMDLGEADLHASLLAAVTRLRDARDERLLAAETTIPDVVWFVVLGGGAITMLFASFLGTSSLALHLVLAALLSLSGVLVLVMIVALSHPFRGDFRVTAQPFEAALAKMEGR